MPIFTDEEHCRCRHRIWKIVSDLKVQKAIKSKLSQATLFKFEREDDILVYCEKQKSGCTGQFTLLRVCANQGYVTDSSKTLKFNVAQLLPY